MKTVLYLFLLNSALIIFPLHTYAQPSFIPAQLVEGFKEGNAKTVGIYFNSHVEILVFDDRDVYSKTQAEMIVKKFFDNNTPLKFDLTYKSGSKNIKFGVGDLTTKTSIYSIYFMLKKSGNKYLIHQLKIERKM